MKKNLFAEIRGVKTEYVLDIGKRAGSYLSIRDGKLSVRLPYGMTEADALRLISQHEEWIVQKTSDSLKRSAERSSLPVSYADGERFTLLGKKRTLRIEQAPQYKEPLLTDGELYIYIGKSMTERDAARLTADFLNKLCESRVRQAFERYSPILGLYPEKVTVKRMISRWGSCSSSGNISMNLGLICFEQRCIDYVAVHELCHLKYMNHSKEFWSLVSVCIPEYKEIRERMKH